MKSRAVRLCLVLAAASLLCGCSVFDEIGGWFSSSGKKSNLRGVRIPVMALDSDLAFNEAGFDPIFTSPAGHPRGARSSSGFPAVRARPS